VATEVAVDGQSLLCTSCGSEVRKVLAPSLHPDMRRARELLSRLSANAGDAPESDEDDATALHTESKTLPTERSQPVAPLSAAASDRQIRIDRSHPAAHAAQGHIGAPVPPRSAPQASSAGPALRRDDDGHQAIPGPHFEVTRLLRRQHPGRAESTWGQLLAYFGVAVLTIGTALILWGYFGGPTQYAPTGWLIATAGQMLLFLGVITLVSGGMQQTTHEVSTRVAHLDGRMIRIEQTAEQLLKGPHFGRDRAAKPSAKAVSDGEDAQPA
jgi:hypothetical protein